MGGRRGKLLSSEQDRSVKATKSKGKSSPHEDTGRSSEGGKLQGKEIKKKINKPEGGGHY